MIFPSSLLLGLILEQMERLVAEEPVYYVLAVAVNIEVYICHS